MSKSWSKMNALSVARPVTILMAVILLPISLTSCGRSGSDGKKKTTQKSEDDFLDKDAKPDERKYLLAAKPFFVAVANRKYADAYALLSSHAKARMSFNQFTPAEEQATFQQYESSPYMKVTAEQFACLMRYVPPISAGRVCVDKSIPNYRRRNFKTWPSERASVWRS
jgi:hypothetical protein